MFIGAALPLSWLGIAWQTGMLGVVPDERLLHELGRWGLYLLLATLALGPAFRLTGWPGFMTVRRAMGLWAFAYLLLHALVWMVMVQAGEWAFMIAEILELQHLQVGLFAWLMLVPLALTSMKKAQQRLGRVRWQWLHRLVYLSAAGGVLHFWMVSRVIETEVIVLGLILFALALFRLVERWLFSSPEK
ncbi:sulfite oxidase heme-binding subunit YedZ [Ectothiorhodospira lacustris]|uniref:sulfite oxidase heme-binding subunit YedZ n=1 Tax=Ectothiorhodospira lacustris TaxID=2899127 RepID=UPI001EE92FE0|nr:ferric reductase-like transmembrane domain-containing protein [Ectothiorhodospira lacustris]MCG5501993.1 ferric reductase-like transmembrane domain-containing protein [Ectothiorhodospira lacustris]